MGVIDNSNYGFTLLEILVVISIIGLISVIVPLPTSLISNTNLDLVVDKILSDLRWARMMAIVNNRTYCFRIYSNQNIYKNNLNGLSDYIIYYENKLGQPVVVRHGEYPAELVLYKNLTPVMITDDFYERVKFYGYGTAMTGTIGLKNDEGKLVQIVISQRGRIRVEK
jgi:prepilin-type N-terminal cleavage/methylation domain-containing protein